mmetsp:Transcript_19613/g.33392  ORF Transcript_19613/g.33392 Transcript_19613/m.33392 type:complete len:107 (+) Transcript_19613:188-508(+)
MGASASRQARALLPAHPTRFGSNAAGMQHMLYPRAVHVGDVRRVLDRETIVVDVGAGDHRRPGRERQSVVCLRVRACHDEAGSPASPASPLHVLRLLPQLLLNLLR